MNIEKKLRQEYPHGHPDFIPMQIAKMELHSRKNADYTASDHSQPLGNFSRVSQIMSLYPHAKWSEPLGVAICYLLKQLDAALTLWSNDKGSSNGEGFDSRFGDVSVYADIARIIYKEQVKADAEERGG